MAVATLLNYLKALDMVDPAFYAEHALHNFMLSPAAKDPPAQVTAKLNHTLFSY